MRNLPEDCRKTVSAILRAVCSPSGAVPERKPLQGVHLRHEQQADVFRKLTGKLHRNPHIPVNPQAPNNRYHEKNHILF